MTSLLVHRGNSGALGDDSPAHLRITRNPCIDFSRQSDHCRQVGVATLGSENALRTLRATRGSRCRRQAQAAAPRRAGVRRGGRRAARRDGPTLDG
jgi:hypothetical protein